MEQPSNGISASTAYEMACRYNNLFQYNPAAAAAVYGMFNNSSSKTSSQIGSTNSPFQPIGTIATSSLPSSSSSNLTSSPTSSLSSLASNSSKQDNNNNNNNSNKLNSGNLQLEVKSEVKLNESQNQNKSKNSYDNVSDNGSLSESSDVEDDNNRSRLSSSSECADDECEKEIDLSKIQQKLNTEAEKSISTCLNLDEEMEEVNLEESKQESDDDNEENPNKKPCLDNNNQEHSLSSIMNSLIKKDDNNSLLNLNRNDFENLKKSLLNSVTQAIENTLESFYSNSKNVIREKPIPKVNIPKPTPAPAPVQKRIRINEKISKNSIVNNNSQNFNVSKILSKDVNNLNKRKLNTSDSYPSFNNNTNNSLLHSKTLPNNGSQSLLTANPRFFLPYNQPPPPVHNPPVHSNYNPLSTHIPPLGSTSSTPSNTSTNSGSSTNSTNPGISSIFAAHQHQLLMAAAQAAAANGQNSNYLQMAAAANRLFTPYLIDQQTSQQKPSFNQTIQPTFSQFNSPHKRRRTKVTDTRLSPRNPLVRTGILGMVQKSNSRDESPVNDDDEQENEYDDEQNQNQEDDTASSGCNESGSTSGSNPRTQNGYLNNAYEMSNENNSEYNAYQNTNFHYTSTLSSLHLRKAKLMFFFSRYPSSTTLRNFFPDVKFNKANTAQLVKWFSNFREFFYIQMEKYARQHLAEGVRNAEDLVVDCDSEIFRALNSHYNRNNQLEIPATFCYVIQATLREFFKAIQEAKDLDPSWKKAIYKIIARMDDTIPEYFKSVQWMESLETSI
ncbi:unnamed protein product [Brachionus calyciflorus]|uniref:Prospero domain-containing protein n=1 Tax=Brachionus calyciflorus TaxID=104777 RepID=A0A813MZJ9_9BILA|nr:unnamed protein product [Brachionus calyciflorus]